MTKRLLSMILSLSLVLSCLGGVTLFAVAEDTATTPYWEFNFDANGNWFKTGGTVRTILNDVEAPDASGNITKGTLIGEGLGYGYNVATADDGLYFGGFLLNNVPEGEAVVFAIDYYLNSDTTSDDVMLYMTDNTNGTVEYKALATKQNGTVFYVLSADAVAATKGNKWGGDMRLRIRMKTTDTLFIKGARLINLDDYCTADFANEVGKADLHTKMQKMGLNVTNTEGVVTCDTCHTVISDGAGDGPIAVTPYWEFNFDANGNWFKTDGTVRTILNGEEAKDATGNITKGTLIGDGLGYGYNVAAADDGLYFGGFLLNNVPEGEAVVFAIDYYLNSDTTSDSVMLYMTDATNGTVEYKSLATKQNGTVFYVLSADAVAATKGNKWGGDMRLRIRMKTTDTLFVKGARLINLDDYCTADFANEVGKADLHVKMQKMGLNVTNTEGTVTCNTCDTVISSGTGEGPVVVTPYWEFYFDAGGNWFKTDGTVRTILNGEEAGDATGNITKGTLIGDGLGYGYNVAAADDGLYFGGTLLNAIPDGKAAVFAIEYYLNSDTTSDDVMLSITDNVGEMVQYKALTPKQNGTVFYVLTADVIAATKGNKWGGDMRLRIRIKTPETLFIKGARLVNLEDYCHADFATEAGKADLHAIMFEKWLNVDAPDYVAPTHNTEGQTGVVTCATCGDLISENKELPALGFVVPPAYKEFYFNADGSVFRSDGSVVRYITGVEETNTNIAEGMLINEEIGYGYAVTTANDGLYFGGKLFENVSDTQAAFLIEYYLDGESNDGTMLTITDNVNGEQEYKALTSGEKSFLFYKVENVNDHKENEYGGDMRLRIRMKTTDTLYITAVKLIPLQDNAALVDLIRQTAEITKYKSPASVALYMEEVARAQAIADNMLSSKEQIADAIEALQEAASLLVDCDHACGTERINYVEETCLTVGYSGDLSCIDCGYIAPENVGTEIPAHETRLINVKEATCAEAGYTGDYWCVKCETVAKEGRETNKALHTWGDGVVTKEATKDERGELTKTCGVCGEKSVTYLEFVAQLGDVDGNAKVDSTDARLVLQFAVKKIAPTALDLSVADVDGSGKVDSTDARLILQYAVKKIDKFPAA